MTSTILISKSSVPAPPNSGDIRGFFNQDGIWCSEDENGVVTVYANTSSHSIKDGVIQPSSFSGNPKKYQVIFDSPYSDNNYIPSISGSDGRNWTPENLTTNGFIINSNANKTLIGLVYWSTVHT